MTQPPWLADYRALSQAGFVRLPNRTQLEITGKDRATFLHAFCTQDIKSLQPGQGTEAFITSGQGKVIGHGFVFCFEDKLLFDTVPNQAAALIKHLDRYVIREDVKFADRTDERAAFLYCGESSASIEEFVPYMSNMLSHIPQLNLGGLRVDIRHVPLTSFPTWELVCNSHDADALLVYAGKNNGYLVSPEALEAARIEARFPLYGVDITDKNLPQEVDRDKPAISFKKGCYLGQETVARIDAIGHVNRLLRLVQFAGDAVPPPGTELRAGDKVVGEVTSSSWSPKYSAPIALAYVRSESAASGTSLEAACEGSTVAGRVT